MQRQREMATLVIAGRRSLTVLPRQSSRPPVASALSSNAMGLVHSSEGELRRLRETPGDRCCRQMASTSMPMRPMHDATTRPLSERTNLEVLSPFPDDPLAFLASVALPTPACAKDSFLTRITVPTPPSTKESSSSPGRIYVCRQCLREYASTDAARKHARTHHPEWIQAQGQGCPSLYCTIVDDAGEHLSPTGFAPKTPTTPSIVDVAESFVALSKQAASNVATPLRLDQLSVQARPKSLHEYASRKRPRTVRCGTCVACARDDCGVCKNCVDKPKFGGLGKRKLGCIEKVCRSRVADEYEEASLQDM